MSDNTTPDDTPTNNDNNNKDTKLSQKDIEDKLKTTFSGLNDTNIRILAYYLYKYPQKWNPDNLTFAQDVNKLIPEAFAYNLRPSNMLLGAIISIGILLFIGILWWIIMIFINKNNNNLLDDPTVTNITYI